MNIKRVEFIFQSVGQLVLVLALAGIVVALICVGIWTVIGWLLG